MKKLLGTLFTLILVLALAPTALAAKDADDVAYPAEGGNIYIDESTKTVTDADETVTAVKIPSTVTSIGDYAFYDCSSLTGITIPDSVTSIGKYAFCYSGLTSVTIPNSIASLEKCVFGACYRLTSVIIPDSVTSIGVSAFEDCDNLTSIIIPDSVTSIGDAAFEACYSLTSVIIPDSVTSIGDGAFENCKSLTSLNIPDSVTSIGDWAFSGCDSLTNVTIPSGAKNINAAFRNCTNLVSVTIPDGVTSIATAFINCSSLTSVTIPNTVTNIAGAFNQCKRLANVTIPNSVTSIGDWTFDGCSGLTSVTIPNSVASIGEWGFRFCRGLTSVFIPDGVTNIGVRAFYGCSNLTRVFIPGSVTLIDREAFTNCKSLTDIYFGGTEQQWKDLCNQRYFYSSNVNVHYNFTVSIDGFTDLEDWNKDTVKWAVSNNFASAWNFNSFGSDAPCPRWEVVSILWKAMGSPEPTITSAHFTDVSPDAPYYKAVLWAYENRIATGNSATTFGPNDTVKRCDAMTFIYRAAKEPSVSSSASFKDVPAGEYYTAPIAWASQNGIAYGTDFNVFSPFAPVTRAQMVTFLYRFAMKNK